MIRKKIIVALLFFVTNISISIYAQKAYYKNPIIDSTFADPAILYANDGFYYAYATNTILNGKSINFQVARSTDLVHWSFLGDAMPIKPAWADKTSQFWAPHVIYDTTLSRYFMYYSSSNNSNDGMCIAIATSDKPEGPFTDKGEPLICGEGFINIDPMAFDDPVSGKKLLYWGSGFKPLKVQEIAPDRLNFAPGTASLDIVFTGREKNYTILLEAPWVNYHNGHYYIFYSGDNCCGEKANYAVLVSRSENPFGPFISLGDSNGSENSVILEQKGYWCAPGHNSIITDKNGDDWMIYHAISQEKKYTEGKLVGNLIDRRVMLMDRVYYSDGWPFVFNKMPSESLMPAPFVGK